MRQSQQGIAARDLWTEVVASVASRSTKTVLTILGMALGVGTIVAVLGLSTTASAQIDAAFDPMIATQVRWKDASPVGPDQRRLGISLDVDRRLAALHGVRVVGHAWTVDTQVSVEGRPAQRNEVKVEAVSPGYVRAAGGKITGVPITDTMMRNNLRVALVGSSAASALGITDLRSRPTLMIGGVGYKVIGFLGQTERAPDLPSKVLIPSTTALRELGKPVEQYPLTALAVVQQGAAHQVAAEGSRASGAGNNAWFPADPIAPPPTARSMISSDLRGLLYALAGVTMVIAIVGIANTTLVSTMERRTEIGLRQALGARPRDIVVQLLTESALLGAIGGLIGSACGTVVVVLIAWMRGWTAIMEPSVTLVAPLIGVVCAAVAGAYPAWLAARMEPLSSLRR